jgi:hypothetical protein
MLEGTSFVPSLDTLKGILTRTEKDENRCTHKKKDFHVIDTGDSKIIVRYNVNS